VDATGEPLPFQNLVLAADTEETDKYYQRALEEEFKETPKADLPHLVLIEHLGLEAERRGGERNSFFSPQRGAGRSTPPAHEAALAAPISGASLAGSIRARVQKAPVTCGWDPLTVARGRLVLSPPGGCRGVEEA